MCTIRKLRWPTSVTAKEKSSRQKKNFRDKRKILAANKKLVTAKEKLPRQKKNIRGKKEIGYGKRKKVAAKEKLLQQKKVTHRKKQKIRQKLTRKTSLETKF